MCFSSRKWQRWKAHFCIRKSPRGTVEAQREHGGQIKLNLKQKVECDFPFYGRWQYDALGSAGSIGGTLCLFLRLRDRIFFPEPVLENYPPGSGLFSKKTMRPSQQPFSAIRILQFRTSPSVPQIKWPVHTWCTRKLRPAGTVYGRHVRLFLLQRKQLY